MDIINELDTFLELKNAEDAKEHDEPKDNEFFASSALYCPRKVQWEKHNEVEYEGETLRKFLIGNLLHDYLQNNIFIESKGFKNEVRYVLEDGDISVRGRVDVESEDEVIEIKSIARLPKDKLEHHIAQVGIYMRITGKKGKILYIEKIGGNIIEFDVDKEEGDIACEKALRLFHQIYSADVKGEEAPGEKTWLCRFCKNVECEYK